MKRNEFKILIVDDSRNNLDILCHILEPETGAANDTFQPGYRVSIAKTGIAALERAASDRPDLILLDIIMPGMSGFEVLAQLKKSEFTHAIPVIIITGLDSVEDEEEGFRLGAVDYITKPFHKSLVKARINTHLKIVEQMRIIEQIGLIDPLTGVPNRRSFDLRLETEWRRCMREKAPLSFLMIDVDCFKRLNDAYGHLQGDQVLKTIAGLIQSSGKRPSDFAARWGGEEFAVLLPRTEMAGALSVAEKIRRDLERTAILGMTDDSRLNLTVSIGVSSVIPCAQKSITEFIGQADKALYKAKAAGRNRVEGSFSI